MKSPSPIEALGYKFEWRVLHWPRWEYGHGWRGAAIEISLDGGNSRPLVVEYELEKKSPSSSGYNRQRSRITPLGLRTAIAAAMAEGWKPTSRGRAFTYQAPFSPNYNGD